MRSVINCISIIAFVFSAVNSPLNVVAKSIDEFVLSLEGYPALSQGMHEVGKEIKIRIREEIGESLTVSIGIAPNRFLAKTAAGLNKPDGLDEINANNFHGVYSRLRLMDLCGIKEKNCVRLQTYGIYSVFDFYNAQVKTLRAVFEAITGYYWYLRLRGWEIDDVEFGRHSFGNSFALPDKHIRPEDLAPILTKLVEKTGQRMRKANYSCRGVHVALGYTDGTHWHKGMVLKRDVSDSREIYKTAFRLLCTAPYRKPVSILAESVFNLQECGVRQLDLFEDVEKQHRLIEALDHINSTYGNFVITPARMLGTQDLVQDRISFGGVKELEERLLLL
jgi:DNA polymerase-4